MDLNVIQSTNYGVVSHSCTLYSSQYIVWYNRDKGLVGRVLIDQVV